MVELTGKLHAESLHNGARSEIAREGEGHQFSETKPLEAECDGGSCSLRGIAQSPRGLC